MIDYRDLQTLNAQVNWALSYKDDGKRDYWQTPEETELLKSGDCEDYAILKLAKLRELGVNWDSLRLSYGVYFIGRVTQAHMVLKVKIGREWYVLDSLGDLVVAMRNKTAYREKFSFNPFGIWVGERKANSSPRARIRKWDDVLTKSRRLL